MSEIEGHVETPSPTATASVESTNPTAMQSMQGGAEATPAGNAPVTEAPAETSATTEAAAPVRSRGMGMRSMQGVSESPPPSETTTEAPANAEAIAEPSKVAAAPAESSAPSAEATRVAAQENVAATGVGDKTTPAVSDAFKPPREIHTLDDGTQVAITGDLHRFKDLNKQQGEMDDFQGTCGLCSVRCVGNEFGKNVTETDLVGMAKDHKPNSLCDVNTGNKYHNGGTTAPERNQLLNENLGIPSTFGVGKNCEDLGTYIDNGQGVILSVNSSYLWGQENLVGPEDLVDPDHAVTVIDVARHPTTNEIKGFFINDSGNFDNGKGSGKFIDKEMMEKIWVNMGGECNVTKISHR